MFNATSGATIRQAPHCSAPYRQEGRPSGHILPPVNTRRCGLVAWVSLPVFDFLLQASHGSCSARLFSPSLYGAYTVATIFDFPFRRGVRGGAVFSFPGGIPVSIFVNAFVTQQDFRVHTVRDPRVPVFIIREWPRESWTWTTLSVAFLKVRALKISPFDSGITPGWPVIWGIM